MHRAPAPTTPGPGHHGQHVPGHGARGPRHINPPQQVKGARHPPARGRVPRPWTASTKRPTPTHPRGQTVAGTRWGKKGPPTRSGPHHRTPHSPPTKGLRHGTPHSSGGTSQAHHNRRSIHPRRPRPPLGPHCHPSDAPTTAKPLRPRQPLPHQSLLTPQGHATLPPLHDRNSHRIVGHPGHAPPTSGCTHPESRHPMVGPPRGTLSPHGNPGLHPTSTPGRPPTRTAASLPSHHPHRLRGRPVGSPPHGTLLGSRITQRSRHTGTNRGLR